MSEDYSIEIYRQRYETFRHLDKLRWQMLQIVIAVVSLSAVVTRANESQLHPLFIVLIGVIFILISYAMKRIDSGIRLNGIVLSDFGNKIGDESIPEPSNSYLTSSSIITIFVFASGLICLAIGSYLYFTHLCGGSNA